MKSVNRWVGVVLVIAFILGVFAHRTADASFDTLVTGSVTCGATATQFPNNRVVKVSVFVPPSGVRVWFGDENVNDDDGYVSRAAEDAINEIQLKNTRELYCIVASGTQEVAFIGVR